MALFRALRRCVLPTHPFVRQLPKRVLSNSVAGYNETVPMIVEAAASNQRTAKSFKRSVRRSPVSNKLKIT